MEALLLASTSPRRSHILSDLGIPFVLADPATDESERDGLPPMARVVALAVDKARAAAARAGPDSPRLVLAADTLVCLRRREDTAEASGTRDEELVLGKPRDREDAGRMIRLLAGRTHIVHTGLALLDRRSNQLYTTRSDSFVSFSAIDEQEVVDYLDSDEWDGVAGAYRIQGWTALFIERIEGSWSGIMGLPIHELYDILRQAKYRLRPVRAN